MNQLNLLLRHWPGTVPLEDSAYFYLFAFLQLVDGYGPDHRCWPLFGDVQNLSFWDWWNEREYDVFAHGSSLGVWELNTDEDVAKARAEGLVIVSVDMSCSRAYLDKYFHEILVGHGVEMGRKRTRKNGEIAEPKWFFEAKPDTQALRLYLDVYRLSKQGLSHWEVAKQLKINTTATQNNKRNVIEATVSRYLKKANRIIKGLNYGKFPVYYEIGEGGMKL